MDLFYCVGARMSEITVTDDFVTTRRAALTSAGLTAFAIALFGCTAANSGGFEQAKAYLDAGANATIAAGQQFLVGPPAPSAASKALVEQGIAALQQVLAAVDVQTAPTGSWKADATQALAFIQQLSPLVAGFLGAAGAYLPLAVAVVTAFIASLPPPTTAPVVPPAALVRKAAQVRR